MKRRGISGIISILLLGLMLIGATACRGSDEELSEQLAEGGVDLPVTARGNLESVNEMELTFGVGGKIDRIYIEEGAEVSKGEVLATLDTYALELAVTQAQVALTQAQINLDAAEYNLEQTQDLYILSDIKVATSDVEEAERYLNEALEKINRYYPGSPGEEYWQRVIIHAQARLNAAEDKLEAMLSGTDTEEVAMKKLQIEAAEQSLAQAEQSLEYAQKQLAEATIKAPFGGIVSKIGAKEGEFLSPAAFTGKTIVEIVDLGNMELIARVDELDIAKVRIGQKVMISVDAMPEAKLEGRVTFISPIAREPEVVLFEDEDEAKDYEVKIDFDIPEGLPIRAGMSATAEIIVE